MSTTVKQSSYKEIIELYEEKWQEVNAVYSRIEKAEDEKDEDIRDERSECCL